MTINKRTGPPSRKRRTPRRRASWPAARSSNTALASELQDGKTPDDVVREMRDAGAVFYIAWSPDRRNCNFAYRVKRDGLAQCRAIIARAKTDPVFYSRCKVAVFVEIMRTSLGLGA